MVTALVMRNSFPDVHLEIRLQHPVLPQTAEKPLQYYQDQRGLGNQHGFSHSHSLRPQRANDCSSEHKVYPIKSELEDNVFLPRR